MRWRAGTSFNVFGGTFGDEKIDGDNYLAPFFAEQHSSSSDTGNTGQPWPAGEFTALVVNVSAAPGTGDSWTFTLRRNSTDTAATCTLSGSETSCTWSGSAVFTTGGRLSLWADEAGSANETRVTFAASFTPDF